MWDYLEQAAINLVNTNRQLYSKLSLASKIIQESEKIASIYKNISQDLQIKNEQLKKELLEAGQKIENLKEIKLDYSSTISSQQDRGEYS